MGRRTYAAPESSVKYIIAARCRLTHDDSAIVERCGDTAQPSTENPQIRDGAPLPGGRVGQSGWIFGRTDDQTEVIYCQSYAAGNAIF